MRQGSENNMVEPHQGLDAPASTESHDIQTDQIRLRQAENEEVRAKFLGPCEGRAASARVEAIKARLATYNRS
jgi:hypothetical protein